MGDTDAMTRKKRRKLDVAEIGQVAATQDDAALLDRDALFELVNREGAEHRHALQRASPDHRADAELVAPAVKRNPCALVHAAAELQRDFKFVLELVKWNG